LRQSPAIQWASHTLITFSGTLLTILAMGFVNFNWKSYVHNKLAIKLMIRVDAAVPSAKS